MHFILVTLFTLFTGVNVYSSDSKTREAAEQDGINQSAAECRAKNSEYQEAISKKQAVIQRTCVQLKVDAKDYKGCVEKANVCMNVPDDDEDTDYADIYSNCPMIAAAKHEDLKKDKQYYQEKKEKYEEDIKDLTEKITTAQNKMPEVNLEIDEIRAKAEKDLNIDLNNLYAKYQEENQKLIDKVNGARDKLTAIDAEIFKLSQNPFEYKMKEIEIRNRCEQLALDWRNREIDFINKQILSRTNRVNGTLKSFARGASSGSTQNQIIMRANSLMADCMRPQIKAEQLRITQSIQELQRERANEVKKLQEADNSAQQVLERIMQKEKQIRADFDRRLRNDIQKEKVRLLQILTELQNAFSNKNKKLADLERLERDSRLMLAQAEAASKVKAGITGKKDEDPLGSFFDAINEIKSKFDTARTICCNSQAKDAKEICTNELEKNESSIGKQFSNTNQIKLNP
jgi:hypothetical protein